MRWGVDAGPPGCGYAPLPETATTRAVALLCELTGSDLFDLVSRCGVCNDGRETDSEPCPAAGQFTGEGVTMGIMVSEIYEALIAAGAPEDKAKAAAEAIPVSDLLATREDIADLKAATKRTSPTPSRTSPP